MDNLLLKCGFVLKHGKEPNQLSLNPVVFQKKLADHLQFLADNLQSTDDLMEALARYNEDKNNFFFALQDTIAIDLENSGQDKHNSLFQLLLGINSLQKPVANLLFDKLAELTEMDETIEWQGANFSFAHLIVNQFRHIRKLKNSEEFCRKILEILEVVTGETQYIIIRYLPEIFPDNCHPAIGKSLCAFLKNYSPATAHVLDALSSLNISTDLVTEIENSTAFLATCMKLENLPVAIRFLFKTCGERKVEVISSLRKTLSSTVFISNPQQVNEISFEERNHAVAILNQLKFFIQTNTAVAEAWIEVIRWDVDRNNEVIDLLIILILCTIPSIQTEANILLRREVKSGLFHEKSLTSIFESYHWAIKDYFDMVMKFAMTFVKCHRVMLSKFGLNLYKNSYEYFDFGFKQAVIEKLVNLFANYHNENEMYYAIKLLTELSEKDPKQMASFSDYIKPIINYFKYQDFPMHHVRPIYSCLIILAFKGGREGELLQHDLDMIIQTQLTHCDLRQKRIGIIGSLMLVRQLASGNIDDEHSKRAFSLFELLYASVRRGSIRLALFYDIVSSLLLKDELDADIMRWIKDNVRKSFLHSYIINRHGCAPEYLQFGLHENSAGGIAVNVYLAVLKQRSKQRPWKLYRYYRQPFLLNPKIKKESLTVLNSHFRLLQIDELIRNGELKELDELLVCPVVLFRKEKLENFTNLDEEEKSIIFSTLFFTLNWFRELINAFTLQVGLDVRRKVVSRLKHITQLETILNKFLEIHLCDSPPEAHFESDYMDRKYPTKIKEPMPVSRYKIYFRELDFDVFDLLKERLILPNSLTISQMGNIFLTPLELNFLLEDLKAKLVIRLQSTEDRRVYYHRHVWKFFRFANLFSLELIDVVEKTINLIPHLCFHLVSANEYFQMVNTIVPITTSPSDSWLLIAKCQTLILESLSALFSWKDFEQHPTLQQTAVRYLANWLLSSDEPQLNIENSVDRVLDYLMKFKPIPNFYCAFAILSIGEKLLALNKTEANEHRLSIKAEEFLKRWWGINPDGDSLQEIKFNRVLQKLLKLTFELNSYPLSFLQTLTTVALPELTETQKESNSYRTMTKASFGVYYRVMFTNLVKEANKISNDNSDDVEVLRRWNLAAKIFHTLVITVKIFGNIANFTTCLKNSRTFVEILLKFGMPLMDSALRSQVDNVLKLPRILLLSAHFLHNICSHKKIVHHFAFGKYVPLLKQALELFIHRVKAMLTLNRPEELICFENLNSKGCHRIDIHLDHNEKISEQVYDEDEGTFIFGDEYDDEDEDEDWDCDKYDNFYNMFGDKDNTFKGEEDDSDMTDDDDPTSKNSRIFIETFLKFGMSSIDSAIQSRSLLGGTSTHFLYNICCHYEIVHHYYIGKRVPLLKQPLDLFIYRVKAMLALHKLQELIWLENLNSRDIHRRDIHLDNEKNKHFYVQRDDDDDDVIFSYEGKDPDEDENWDCDKNYSDNDSDDFLDKTAEMLVDQDYDLMDDDEY